MTGRPSELTDELLDQMILVNVKSVMYGVQAILSHFRERKQGQFVNVSSLLGRLPLAPLRSAYIVAKHALDGYSAVLRMDLKAENILVTVIHPGLVATEFSAHAIGSPGPDIRTIPNAQPPEEVAEVMVESIVKRLPEIYTRPAYKQLVENYYSANDVSAVEATFVHYIKPKSQDQ